MTTVNREKLFGTVKAHLLAQGERATNEQGACVYRGAGGLKCAIGCLISDEAYAKYDLRSWDNGAAIYDGDIVTHINIRERDIIASAVGLSQGMELDDSDVDFLFELQSLHDVDDPAVWPRALAEMEKEYAAAGWTTI